MCKGKWFRGCPCTTIVIGSDEGKLAFCEHITGINKDKPGNWNNWDDLALPKGGTIPNLYLLFTHM